MNVNLPEAEAKTKETGENKQTQTSFEWNVFLNRNRSKIERFIQPVADENGQGRENESENRSDITQAFLKSWFAPESEASPLSRDIEHLREGLKSIIGLRNENVLNDKEAKALLEFIASRFVTRRFDRILRHMLPYQESDQWFHRTHLKTRWRPTK